MSEISFNLPPEASKEARYQAFMPLFASLVSGDGEAPVSLLANAAAALKEAFGFFWVGFYLVQGEELILGPFQGSPACTRIARGRGVCGSALAREETLVVPDVDCFPGHIACSSRSRSELVIPLRVQGRIYGVLDIDSTALNDFSPIDRRFLEQACRLLCEALEAAEGLA